MSVDDNSPNNGPRPSTFRLEAGHRVEVRPHASTTSPQVTGLSSDVLHSEEGAFTIMVPTSPRWLDVDTDLEGEVWHPDGRELFTTTVLAVEAGRYGVRVTFQQPWSTWRYSPRRAERTDVELMARYSVLDGDGRPGPTHETVVNDISVTGMRLSARAFASKGDEIVATVVLPHGPMNVVGTLVADVGPFSGEMHQMRIDFHRLDDEIFAVLAETVAGLSGIERHEVLAPALQHKTLPRRVIEAYAASGADRR